MGYLFILVLGLVLVFAAIVLVTPALFELWEEHVERSDRCYAKALLSGEAKDEKFLARANRKFVSMMQKSKFDDVSFEEQLGSALPMMAKNMQTGRTFEQSAEIVARHMPDPLKAEFAQVVAERRMGMTIEQSMNNMAARTGSRDAAMLASAVAVQAQTGGAIGAVLETIGLSMRRRARTRRHVSITTKNMRFSAIVVALVPLILLVLQSFMVPENAVLLFSNPVGWVALALAAVLDVLGVFVIRRLYNITIY